jgi:hypothetical protein
MSKKKPDVNQNAARIVGESAKRSEQALPADLEDVWEEWSRGVAKVDARGMTLLRAAFEMGVKAAKAAKSR